MNEQINDCTLIQYADDTQFIHSAPLENLHTLVKNVEDTLSKAVLYFNKNGLMLNTQKTQCIYIGSRQLLSRIPDDTTILLCGSKIEPSNNVKSLGLYIDQYLLFDRHIDEMCRKILGTLIYVNRIKYCFDKPTRQLIINSLVFSIMNYCNTIWGTTTNTLLTKVQKLQNFAAKVVEGKAQKYDHVTPIIKELEWLNVSQQITFNTAIDTYKHLNGQHPEHLMTLPCVNTVTNSTTRQQSDLYVPRSRTDTGARQLCIRGPKLWNTLPPHIANGNSLSKFKCSLKEFLLNQN